MAPQAIRRNQAGGAVLSVPGPGRTGASTGGPPRTPRPAVTPSAATPPHSTARPARLPPSLHRSRQLSHLIPVCHTGGLIPRQLDAYAHVRPNLLQHAPGYPTAESLRAVTAIGQPRYGLATVGEGQSTPGSRLLLAAADKADPRPLWVSVWGGANTLAQALWDARMDWCVANDFKQANHNPIAVLNGDRTKNVLHLTVPPGETLTLNAEGSSDPDGDALELRWWIYPEASTLRDAKGRRFPDRVTLSATRGVSTRFVAPVVSQPETVHVILEIEDRGTPSLFAYRRAVLTLESR